MVYRSTAKTERRKAARRKRLLEAAIALFGEKGFHDTTVPQIVDSAGSSTGSFYFYFRNKEDIFVAAMRALEKGLSAAIDEATHKQYTPREQLAAAVEALFLFLASSPHAARILITEAASLGGEIEKARKAILHSHARSVAETLAALNQAASNREAEVASWCWVGSVLESAVRWLDAPAADRLPATEMARFVARFNMRAVGVG